MFTKNVKILLDFFIFYDIIDKNNYFRGNIWKKDILISVYYMIEIALGA